MVAKCYNKSVYCISYPHYHSHKNQQFFKDAETICSTLYFCEQEETHETDEVPKLEEHLPAQQASVSATSFDFKDIVSSFLNQFSLSASVLTRLKLRELV